jgi:hypothetical protein
LPRLFSRQYVKRGLQHAASSFLSEKPKGD